MQIYMTLFLSRNIAQRRRAGGTVVGSTLPSYTEPYRKCSIEGFMLDGKS
jgi:hypothetical protein